VVKEVIRKPFEVEMVDIMGGSERWEIKIHEHGICGLLDVMPRLVPQGKTADFAIVQAARVSYGAGTKAVNEDTGLIRYLARHRHTTPFEMVEFKFHHAMPLFIARQWIRHRTANVNEYSARYSIVKDRFYHPDIEAIRAQSKTNKQGGEEPVDNLTAQEFLNWLDEVEKNYEKYEQFAAKGIARELARIGLPTSVYTEWYWKIDLHNLLHFLSLRMDPHAQKEIRDYAWAMFHLIQPIVPVAAQAFLDYNFESIRLTRLEVEALKNGKVEYRDSDTGLNTYAVFEVGDIATENKREQAEWQEKKKRLGLGG
jgi:thymidylate synthase (FAD)